MSSSEHTPRFRTDKVGAGGRWPWNLCVFSLTLHSICLTPERAQDELASCFVYQVGSLTGFLKLHGLPLNHVSEAPFPVEHSSEAKDRSNRMVRYMA